jgi:hypothetical protein
MAWSAPPTAVTGAIITAAFWNTGGRDNLIDLDRRTSPLAATVNTGETTSSTTYTDLATVGPAVTVTIGSTGKALVAIYASLANTTNNYALAGYAVSGASVVAAADLAALQHGSSIAIRAGATLLHQSLVAGSNTFTMKYRKDAGAGVSDFTGRRLLVTPLGS